jgi:hypothetical protein
MPIGHYVERMLTQKEHYVKKILCLKNLISTILNGFYAKRTLHILVIYLSEVLVLVEV